MKYNFTDIECEIDGSCLTLRAFNSDADIQAEYYLSKEDLMEYYEDQFYETKLKWVSYDAPPENQVTLNELSLSEWYDAWGFTKGQMWELFYKLPADKMTIIIP